MDQDTAHHIRQSRNSMLGIYLNDHLAGATAGTDSHAGWRDHTGRRKPHAQAPRG